LSHILSAKDKQFIVKAKLEGFGSRYIAKVIGCSKSTVNNFYVSYQESVERPEPKILIFDLEAAADISAGFQRWNVNISSDHVVQEGHWILSAAWKWLGEDEVYSCAVTPEEALTCNDINPVSQLYEAFEKSDIVVAHNLDRYDLPLFKTRLLLNGMDNHRTVKGIDTLKIAKQLKFPSNKLSSIAKYLDIEDTKHEMNIKDWIACNNGCPVAIEKMRKYNAQDVVLLEQVYLRLRSFDNKSSIDRFYADDKERCSSCGHDSLTSTGNTVKLGVSEYEEVICNSCGHRNRKRKNVISKEKRKNIVM